MPSFGLLNLWFCFFLRVCPDLFAGTSPWLYYFLNDCSVRAFVSVCVRKLGSLTERSIYCDSLNEAQLMLGTVGYRVSLVLDLPGVACWSARQGPVHILFGPVVVTFFLSHYKLK